MNEPHGVVSFQPFARELQHHRVAIESEEQSIGVDCGCNFVAMAAGTNGSVDNSQFRCEIKEFDDFPQQHRFVNRAGWF